VNRFCAESHKFSDNFARLCVNSELQKEGEDRKAICAVTGFLMPWYTLTIKYEYYAYTQF